MNTKQSYHHDLRVIGQSLEAQNINVFEMKCEMGRYLVNGSPEKPASLMERLRLLRNSHRDGNSRTLSFDAQAIEGLERLGRTHRAKPGGLPDFYNLSNLLRTLGGYLEAKNAELLRIQKQPLNVTLLYRNDGGHPRLEDRTIASFYEIFLAQHGQRLRRS